MSHRSRIFAPALLLILAACSGDQSAMPSPGSGTTSQSATSALSGADGNNGASIGGIVSGLQGSGLTLQLNRSQDLSIATDGPFVFPTALVSGSNYVVSVKDQPAIRRETCAVSNASGTIAQTNVTDVAISCAIVTGFLYSAAGPNDHIVSYGISPGTGALLPIGSPVETGSNPWNIATAAGGKFLYVGNFGSNSISAYAVNSDSGALTAIGSTVPTISYPATMVMSASGLLFVYGEIPGPAPGIPANPSTSVLSTYAVDAVTGALSPVGTVLTFDGDTASSLAATSDGKFLYVLNTDYYANVDPLPTTVTAYAIDAATGELTAGPVISPHTNSTTMAIDPLGRFLYLTSSQTTPFQAAATVLPYAINSSTGALTVAGAGTSVASNAAALAADPSGRYLYIINSFNLTPADDSVLALAIDQSSGAVSQIGSVLQTGGQPYSIVCDPSGQFVYVGSVTSDYTWLNLAVYMISTSAATAGQLLPNLLGGQGEQIGSGGSLSASMAVID